MPHILAVYKKSGETDISPHPTNGRGTITFERILPLFGGDMPVKEGYMPDEYKQQSFLPDGEKANLSRTDNRRRFQYKFWLDVAKDDELLLGEELEHLKSNRKFAPTIRDALKLILSLRDRSLDVLLELFPWIEDHFRAKFAIEESPANREFSEMLTQLSALREQLSIRQPVMVGAMSSGAGDMPKFQGSIFAEEESISAEETRETFAAGMGNLFADEDDDLFD